MSVACAEKTSGSPVDAPISAADSASLKLDWQRKAKESSTEQGPPKKKARHGEPPGGKPKPRPEGPQTLVVLGLGNPGGAEQRERHSLGARVVEALASAREGPDIEAVNSEGCKDVEGARWLRWGKGGQDRVLLLLPQRPINDSGLQLQAVLDSLQISGAPVLAVVDDCWLPLGSLRLKANGSSGGHNGLKSIEANCGWGQIYHRLRLGIGGKNLKEFVTGVFTDDEELVLKPLILTAVRAIEAWMTMAPESVQKVMSAVNASSFVKGAAPSENKLEASGAAPTKEPEEKDETPTKEPEKKDES